MSTTVDLGKITASVTVGTTTTGAAGTNASVSNSGTTQDAVLNFTIPRGAQGVQGPQGIQGNTGPAGPTGPQGPMGDVAVITPEQQAAFTMYSVPGQNTDGPMTQKAVTDNLVASAISYDNSQSGLAATDVQGALDEVVDDTTYSNDVTLTSDLVRNYNINANGNYVRSGDSYQCWAIRVYSGEKYRVKANNTVRAHLAFMASDPTSPTNNTPADFIDGYNGRFSVNVGEVDSFIVPESSGNIYLYIQKKSQSYDNTPDFFEKITGVKEKIASLKAEEIFYDTQSGIEADNVQEAIDKVSNNVFENFKEEVVHLTGATNMYIRADGLWSKSSDAGGYLMPIEDADKYYYRLTAGNNAAARVVALLDDSAVSGGTPSYVTGDYTTSRVRAAIGTSIIFRLPQGTNYIWVSRLQLNLDNTPRIEKLQSLDEIVGEIRASEIYYKKGLNDDGTLFDAGAAGAATYKYSVLSEHKYSVSGYSPADSNLSRVSIVCADTDGVALSSYKPCKSAAFNGYVIETPKNCTHILVFNTASGPASLKEYHNTFENAKIESIPQIYNDGHKFYRGSNLKILCFGSSWFMDTWWYLNKLLGDAGVSCELHCYYMGHAKMREWLEFYNGNTTPFSGTEATRSASKNVSVNGSDWTISSYSQSGTYNAESYKNDFVADIKSGDWDIIAFQQGAQECIIAEEWDAKHDVVKMIKENCSYKTTIAFNATFAPALKNYSGDYFPTISRSDYGKEYFQYLNNRNTKLFMADTGIYNVSPNGAMLSLMRTDATLNLSNDMANDGLHPNNGLPILGLCGCFYETFIAPLIGISFDELNWLPTSSTQKASVSGSSYQSCSAEQLAIIKKYVKQALADRFKYYQ